jgi:DNA-binding response OmpR family regulator
MQRVALFGIRNAKFGVAGMEIRNIKKEGQNRKAMDEKAEVLIVEDSEEVIWIMGNVLDHAGFCVDAVTTGKDALRRMREFPETGLVILNYLLPDMSGLTVLERLRESGSRVKVIAVSAMKEVRESLVSAGAFAFLEKPFDVKEFIGLCKQALNRDDGEQRIVSES